MRASAIVLAMLLAGPANAQRDAVSASLFPEAAAEAFTSAVRDVCVPAISGNGISSLAAARTGKVQPTQDNATRRQAGAAPDETVWDVADARGVVTVRENEDECVVTVYGPKVAETIAGVVRALMTDGFGVVRTPEDEQRAPQDLLGRVDGRSIAVRLIGAEPGAPDHQSRFAVVTATIIRIR